MRRIRILKSIDCQLYGGSCSRKQSKACIQRLWHPLNAQVSEYVQIQQIHSARTSNSAEWSIKRTEIEWLYCLQNRLWLNLCKQLQILHFFLKKRDFLNSARVDVWVVCHSDFSALCRRRQCQNAIRPCGVYLRNFMCTKNIFYCSGMRWTNDEEVVQDDW